MKFNYERFAAECRYKKITQVMLSELWGISLASVNKILTGKTDKMSVARLALACELMETTMEMFITKED